MLLRVLERRVYADSRMRVHQVVALLVEGLDRGLRLCVCACITNVWLDCDLSSHQAQWHYVLAPVTHDPSRNPVELERAPRA